MKPSRLAIVVVLALALGSGLAVAAERYHVDDDHGLATAEAVQTFEDEEIVRANVTTPQLSLAVTKQASACGAETGLFSDARNDFLCVEYQNELPQTTRLYIPDDYWTPFVHDEKQPIGGGPVGSMQPTEDGNFTSVTIRFDGATTAVYPIPRDVSVSYALINRINDRTKTIAGYELWSGGTQWRYVNASAFGSSPSVAIKTIPERTMIQYDATPNETSATWVPVPDSQRRTAPVYYMQRPDADRTMYVIATSSDPPPIRYRARGTGIARIDAAVDEIMSVPDKIHVTIEQLLPDWLGGE